MSTGVIFSARIERGHARHSERPSVFLPGCAHLAHKRSVERSRSLAYRAGCSLLLCRERNFMALLKGGQNLRTTLLLAGLCGRHPKSTNFAYPAWLNFCGVTELTGRRFGHFQGCRFRAEAVTTASKQRRLNAALAQYLQRRGARRADYLHG
jgi:hypothetical protein